MPTLCFTEGKVKVGQNKIFMRHCSLVGKIWLDAAGSSAGGIAVDVGIDLAAGCTFRVAAVNHHAFYLLGWSGADAVDVIVFHNLVFCSLQVIANNKRL